MASTINNIKYLGRKFYGIRNLNTTVYDTDAQAYFNVNTAITSTADKNAINTFYLGLKSDGIYTKIKAMYLPIWGSAASCKWNLVNPLDTNAAYRLTFATGMTFTSGGMAGNGTSGYANTFFAPSILTNNSSHISIYSRTNNAGQTVDFDMGVNGGGNLSIILRWNDGNLYADQYNSSTNRITVLNSDSRGYYLSNRNASNVFKMFKNNSQFGTTNTNTSTPNINTLIYNLYICAANRNGVSSNYTTRQYSFASIGDGLTDTEATNFYTRLNTLMTYFGINV